MSTDLLGELKPAPLKMSAKDYERLVQLERGVKILSDELKTLKDRAKAVYEAKNGVSKGEEEHAGADFVFDIVKTKDLKATAAKFPISENPDKYIVPEPVLDLEAIAPKDIVSVPSLRLTVKAS